jgi:hypothetical protein
MTNMQLSAGWLCPAVLIDDSQRRIDSEVFP